MHILDSKSNIGEPMLLNEYTFEEVDRKVDQIPKTGGAAILHVENNGVPNYEWSAERTNIMIATCFEED